MKVAVTGGRKWVPNTPAREWLLAQLADLRREHGPVTLLHGDCRGLDKWAAHVAGRAGHKVIAYPAQWDVHGFAAGPIRNREMVSHADLLLAFPGGTGTADCVRAATRKGVRIVKYT